MRDADVSFMLPDGSTSTVPQEMFSQSTVLCEAVEAASDEDLSLNLPKGLFQSWLAGMDAPTVGSASEEESYFVAKDPRLLDYLMV